MKPTQLKKTILFCSILCMPLWQGCEKDKEGIPQTKEDTQQLDEKKSDTTKVSDTTNTSTNQTADETSQNDTTKTVSAPVKPKTLNEKIYSYFEERYLWRENMPKVNPNQYSSRDLIRSIRNPNNDRWSAYKGVVNVKEFRDNTTYNWPIKVDYVAYQDSLVVRISDTPRNKKYAQVFEQGMEIYRFNGKKNRVSLQDLRNNPSLINEFRNAFYSKNGLTSMTVDIRTYDYSKLPATFTSQTIELKKEYFAPDPVPMTWVKNVDGLKLGYIQLTTFRGTNFGYHTVQTLDRTMRDFVRNGVTHLIVDLRSNGGGYGLVASIFANMLIPTSKKKEFISAAKRSYGKTKIGSIIRPNDKIIFSEKKNLVYDCATSPQLGDQLQKIYFLVNRGTASASETLMLYVSPYIPYELIGMPTRGKHVGGPNQIIKHSDNKEYLFYYVTSKAINGEGESRNTPWEPLRKDPPRESYEFSNSNLKNPYIRRVLEQEGKTPFSPIRPLARERSYWIPNYQRELEEPLLIYRLD